ncbi:MAG: hypothetical protein IIZ92_19660 [Aquincola sp.]|nr:hypothetical protein [Aquincola sp.]
MPAAVAVVAAFAGAATGIAAATAVGASMFATVAGYALAAGSVLSGVGAITGKKDLMKLGAVLSLAGGVGTLASAATSAASGASTAGLSGMDLAADAAAGSANSVSGASAALGGSAATAAPALGEVTLGTAWKDLGQTAIPGGDMVAAVDPMSAGLGAASQASSAAQPSLMDLAAQKLTQPAAGGLADLGGMSATTAPADAVAQGAKGLTMQDVQSLWDKVKGASKGVGQFVKDNKEVVQLAGGALNSMYGPESEMVDLKKSLMERQRRNLNSPAIIQPLKPIGT